MHTKTCEFIVIKCLKTTLAPVRKWSIAFKFLRENFFQYIILYPVKLSIRGKVTIKTLSNMTILENGCSIYLSSETTGRCVPPNLNLKRRQHRNQEIRNTTGKQIPSMVT